MFKKTGMVVMAAGMFGLFAFMVTSPAALAGERVKWSSRDANCALKVDSAQVAGAEKHALYLLQGKGISFIEGQGAVTTAITATMDYSQGVGPARGYSHYSFPDGSTVTMKWEAAIKAGGAGVAGGSGGDFTFTFLNGTGKFQGIEGGGTGQSWILAPGQWYSDGKGEYTLP